MLGSSACLVLTVNASAISCRGLPAAAEGPVHVQACPIHHLTCFLFHCVVQVLTLNATSWLRRLSMLWTCADVGSCRQGCTSVHGMHRSLILPDTFFTFEVPQDEVLEPL